MNLLELDQTLFLWINRDISNVLFDWLMPLIRSKFIWIPAYTFLIGFLLFNFRRKLAIGMIFSIILTVGISDLVSSKLIKNQVQRVRPCNTQTLADSMNHLVVCGSGYSFTSSHAANHFALAFFLINTLAFLHKRWFFGLIFWATIICFAQVYVGLHYPFDVFFGAILGMVIGSLISELYKRTSFFKETRC